jgi:Predicted dehydrogenases and related proteins
MKIGIIGVAHMHVYSYLQQFRDQQVQITGVFDHDQPRAERFAEEKKLVHFTTIVALLETDCDTVVICSENIFHKDYTLQALKAGKHVIVEKPMALNTVDAQEMIMAAQTAERLLMVAHPVRFAEPVQNLKKILDEGTLGALKLINSSNHGKNPGGWFIDPNLSGGGALIDHTVHISDLVNYLFQLHPKEVYAYAAKSQANLPVEDIGLVQIAFHEPVIMSLDTSWNRPKSYPVWGDAILELVFEKGQLTIDGFGRKVKVFNDENHSITDFYFEEDMDSLMIKAFIDAVDQGRPAPVSGVDGLYTVALTEAAYAAATTQQIIYLKEEIHA